MMSKKILTEYYEMCEGGVCEDHLTESEKMEVANGATYLTGIMQKSDQLNGNGRIYPHNVLMREMKNYEKLVTERRALGELDHPEDSVVNLKNASHMVTKVWWDGNNVMGKIKVLNTPSGNILKNLVDGGVKLGISSRGVGSVHEDNSGNTIVEDDFQLICFDFVSEPSTPGAYMAVQEGMEKNFFSKADRINRILNDIVSENE